MPETFKEQYACRGENARRLLSEAINPHAPDALDAFELHHLASFLMVLRNYSGNSGSPTESSLISMVEEYCTAANGGRGITPDDLLQWIESPDGCRIWFDLAVEISRSFRKRYKDILDKADADEEKGDA